MTIHTRIGKTVTAHGSPTLVAQVVETIDALAMKREEAPDTAETSLGDAAVWPLELMFSSRLPCMKRAAMNYKLQATASVTYAVLFLLMVFFPLMFIQKFYFCIRGHD